MFDYGKLLYDSLFDNNDIHDFKNKHLWVKKSAGLGVTEFFLRLMRSITEKGLEESLSHTARTAIAVVLS
jgi:hypothetical protein